MMEEHAMPLVDVAAWLSQLPANTPGLQAHLAMVESVIDELEHVEAPSYDSDDFEEDSDDEESEDEDSDDEDSDDEESDDEESDEESKDEYDTDDVDELLNHDPDEGWESE